MESITMEIRRAKGRKRIFYLLSSEQVLGSLDYPHRFRKQARICIGEKTWLISRQGAFRHRLLMAADQSPYGKWEINQGWSGIPQLRSEDNRQFSLKRKGWIGCKWQWFNERMDAVMDIRSKQFTLHKKGDVSFFQSPDETLLWLALVGWFVVLCYEDDSAVAIVG